MAAETGDLAKLMLDLMVTMPMGPTVFSSLLLRVCVCVAKLKLTNTHPLEQLSHITL